MGIRFRTARTLHCNGWGYNFAVNRFLAAGLPGLLIGAGAFADELSVSGDMPGDMSGDMAKNVVSGLVTGSEYDRQLCATAQRMLLNAGDDPGSESFSIFLQRAAGGLFTNEQMDIDSGSGVINVAMTTVTVTLDAATLDTHVACKMVNRVRVNDVLDLDLSGPRRSCRDVNERTYRLARTTLSPEQRRRYASAGKPLRFVGDYAARAGGEWIPSIINDFMRPRADESGAAYLEIQAPSVQVPWDPVGRDWYKGTHHCKLITLAAMQRWMTDVAFTDANEMFPRSRAACTAPSAKTSNVGSCVFFFGPAGADFCQDFSGPGWTPETARATCGERHATEADWIAMDRRYAGEGGVYSPLSCADRKPAIDEFHGTCVFHCNAPDEALWHVLRTAGGGTEVRGMNRSCDLFLPDGVN